MKTFPSSATAIAIIFSFSFNLLVAQDLQKFEVGCNYDGSEFKEEAYTFASDMEAEQAVDKIMSYTGLPANFTIKAADVPNAQASIQGSERYILYSQQFMERIKDKTHTDWSSISILAHEIGHHLSGHTLDGLGSRPKKELEADRFSGFILQKMGATLDQATATVNTFSEEGSRTHPGRSARVAAVTNGWKAAKDMEDKAKGSDPDHIPQPPQPVIKPIETKPIISIPVPTPDISIPLALILNVWADHNVFEGGRKGMRIHVDFSTSNMTNVKGKCVVYFYMQNGIELRDFNGQYNTTTGQVAVGNDFTGNNIFQRFEDFKLFMPYDELHLNPGFVSDIKFQVKIFSEPNPGVYTELKQSSFTFIRYTP